MENNKFFETQAEIYQALLGGKKITSCLFKTIKYFHLKNGSLIDNMNRISVESFSSPEDWYVYEEPKPKEQVWQWRYQPKAGRLWYVNNSLLSEQNAELEFQNVARYEKHAGPFEVET